MAGGLRGRRRAALVFCDPPEGPHWLFRRRRGYSHVVALLPDRSGDSIYLECADGGIQCSIVEGSPAHAAQALVESVPAQCNATWMTVRYHHRGGSGLRFLPIMCCTVVTSALGLPWWWMLALPTPYSIKRYFDHGA